MKKQESGRHARHHGTTKLHLSAQKYDVFPLLSMFVVVNDDLSSDRLAYNSATVNISI